MRSLVRKHDRLTEEKFAFEDGGKTHYPLHPRALPYEGVMQLDLWAK